jgi:hypothetical protein
MAREITRRFLPDYIRIWDLLAVRMAENNAYADRRAGNWKRVLATGAVYNYRHSSELSGCLRGTLSGPVRMETADSVYIEFCSLPIEVAVKVLEFARTATICKSLRGPQECLNHLKRNS